MSADEKSALVASSSSSGSSSHRETGGAARSRRSLAVACGQCCLTAATLPLALFRRRKSDEVGTRWGGMRAVRVDLLQL